MTSATERLTLPRTPEWARYLNQRLPGETPHPDDQFFEDGAATGTTVQTSGNLTVSERFGRLSLAVNGQTGDEYSGRVFPLTPSTPPVTLESRLLLVPRDSGNANGFLGFGFSDGVSTGSGLAGLFVKWDGVVAELRYVNGTFASPGFVGAQDYGPWNMAGGMFVRLAWTATNSFAMTFSAHPDLFTAGPMATLSRTLSPTHFFLALANQGGTDSLLMADYVRVAEADLT